MTKAPTSSQPGIADASSGPASTALKMPPEIAAHLRQLSHDLSNALEIVLQASYLLGLTSEGEARDDEAARWRAMIDQGVQKAAGINLQLRDYIRAHS